MDPYAAPVAKAVEKDLPLRSVFAYPGWYAGVLLTVFVAVVIGLFASSSMDYLKHFDAELPWLTRVLFTGHEALWLGPMICIGCALARGDSGRRARWSLIAGLV